MHKNTLSQKKILDRLVQDEGKSICEAARIASINLNTARSTICKYRRHGVIELPRGGNNKLKQTDN